jgi:hypothetical protein
MPLWIIIHGKPGAFERVKEGIVGESCGDKTHSFFRAQTEPWSLPFRRLSQLLLKSSLDSGFQLFHAGVVEVEHQYYALRSDPREGGSGQGDCPVTASGGFLWRMDRLS